MASISSTSSWEEEEEEEREGLEEQEQHAMCRESVSCTAPVAVYEGSDEEYDYSTIPDDYYYDDTMDNAGGSATLPEEEPDDSADAAAAASALILEDLNEAQTAAVTQPRHSITRVLAGPGSGKTRVLTCRIAYLLRTGSDSILAVTFTKKAASEMNHRLEKLLGMIQRSSSSSSLNDFDEVRYEDSVVDPSAAAAAAQQMRRVTLGTFHSVCARILRWNGLLLSTLPTIQKYSSSSSSSSSATTTTLDGTFAIADATEQMRVLKEILKQKDIDLTTAGPGGQPIRPNRIAAAISSVTEQLAQGKDPFRTTKDTSSKEATNAPQMLSHAMQVVQKIYRPYRQAMFLNNHLDFDDLIYLTRELLQEYPDVRDRMQRRFNHILVDEFQDTSFTQLDLVRLLTTDSLFVVGDADQSIYSWRGAHVGMMHEFYKTFSSTTTATTNRRKIDTIYLMENYRSTSNIVQAAQKIISSGTKNSVEAGMRQDMKPRREAGTKPRIVVTADDQEEATHVISTIQQALQQGKYGYNHSVAIIYRTNAQSRPIEEACVQHNVPYVIFGSATSFYQRLEVKDCLCFLRWLANGRDKGSMYRAMKTPPRGIGDNALAQFDQYCNDLALYYEQKQQQQQQQQQQTHIVDTTPTSLDILLSFTDDTILDAGAPSPNISTRSRKALTAFSQQMTSIVRYAQTQTVEQLLAYIIDTLELIPYLNKVSKSTAEFEERNANVIELKKASQRYSADGPALLGRRHNRTTISTTTTTPKTLLEMDLTPLASFLEDVALVTDMANSSQQEMEQHFVVRLMTIHTSKGMEFDTVFVIGNEDGTFPTSQAIEKANEEGDGCLELEEERRLCYVAMTRAKSELIMTCRKEVSVFTSKGIQRRTRSPSRFLDVLISPKTTQKKPTTTTRTRRMNNKNLGTNSIYQATPQSQATHLLSAKPTGQKSSTSSSFFGNPRYYSPLPAKQPPKNPLIPSNGKRIRPPKSLPMQDPRNSETARNSPSPRGSNSKTVRSKSNIQREMSPASPRGTDNRAPPQHSPQLYDSHNPKMRSSRSNSQRETSSPPVSYDGVPPKHDKPPLSASTMKTVDSTWFYPVGSAVNHKQWGHGIVLPPPESSDSIDMPVRVKFTSGEQQVFSAKGSDLTPAGGV